MGSFFYSPTEAFENAGEGGPGDPFNVLGPLYSLQGSVPRETSATFGPIAGPQPTTFGTIGGEDMGAFLPGAISNRDSLLNFGLKLGTAVVNRFLPQNPPCGPNDTRLECQFTTPGTVTVPTAPTAMTPGSCMGKGECTTLVTTRTGKQIHRKGHLLALPNGQVICCPKKRRMSPCNAHAARRAVRRLSAVHSFMRSIEKSMSRACSPVTRRRTRRSTGGGCGSCGKIRCTCK